MKKIPHLLAKFRLLVGFMGERNQSGWWDSSFLAESSEAFLRPIFPRTFFQAQYRGVCESAKYIHDERIGRGRNYHLYRMPDAIEKLTEQVIHDSDFFTQLKSMLISKEAALEEIKVSSTQNTESLKGPILVGDYNPKDLEKILKITLGHYLRSFSDGSQCFPFMRLEV